MGELTVPAAPALPGLASQSEIIALLDSFGSRTDTAGRLIPNRRPSLAEREQLQAAFRDVSAELRPLRETKEGLTEARRLLAAMFSGYASMQRATALELVEGYVLHLGDVPIFALRAAINEVRTGRAAGADPDFPPSAPRIQSIVQRHADPAWRRFCRLREVLEAKKVEAWTEPTPEEKQRVGELLADLSRSLGAGSEARMKEDAAARRFRDAETIRRNNEAVDQEWAALGLEPVRVGGLLITPALAQNIAEHNAKLEARKREKDDESRRPNG